MSYKYKISVVTPFHNVDMGMFRNAYTSVKNQTIGFENIQWIVVVHNCDQGYLEAVEELIGAHENVLIKELKNDAHTPSSPRNYGMQFVEGEYLAFLDGDDSFTPTALEITVSKAKAHAADVVAFRREYELENESLTPLTEVTLWNQTFDEIVMDREHWDTEKMFSGVWGMVTSRIFNVRFLRENNIVFDESIPFAEDVDFCASVYSYANIVAYLPQTIGYHYFINGGSLVQSMDKPGETLVGYAKGFALIFEKIMNMGIYVDYTINGICTLLAEYIVNSSTITVEQRETIRDYLEKYLDIAGKSIVNKTCSKEESENSYSFPREVILNPDANRANYHVKRKWDGQDVLSRILQENAETDYGTRYQFPMIQTAKGYQARVPLADMESYHVLSDLQMKIGETGIVTSKPTPLFLSKVMTTGEERFFVATEEYALKIGKEFTKLIYGKKNALFMSSRFPKRVYNAYTTDVTGVMLNHYNAIEYSLVDTGTEIVTPEIVLFPQENTEIMYYQALFALADPDVEQLVASSFWKVSELIDCIKSGWKTMVSDLDKGIVTGPGSCSKKYRRALNAAIVADPERALYLKNVLEGGFGSSTLKKIWPNLSDIIAIGYGSFEIYQDRIRNLVDGVTVSIKKLILPEGIIGEATPEAGVFTLCRDEIFYEFIPFDDRENDLNKPLLMSEVVVGHRYILVLTNHLGLYRYNTGIVIEIKKNEYNSVEFTFCGHIDEYFVDDDFILNEEKVYEQIAFLNYTYDAMITDFAYAVEDRTFTLYYETDKNGGISAKDCTKALNEHFSASHLKDLVAYKIDNGCELLYRNIVNYKYNISNDRLTPIRLITTKEQRQFFEGNVIDKGSDV